MSMKILVTGAAGFIGFHLTKRLLCDGHTVVGVDNLNNYYDVQLKKNRLDQLREFDKFQFHKLNIADRDGMLKLFRTNKFDRVINLAAQAGVRYSLKDPYSYIESNVMGFMNILEGCRHTKVPHLVFASSSSVYGLNTKIPFSVQDNVDHPISIYAATKKSNELMAHSYSYLYGLPTTGLRFFTVYGPWGRPDMAYFLFTKSILAGKSINVFNNGKMKRDFTYIDDIVEGVVRVADKIPKPDDMENRKSLNPGLSIAPYRILNIGNNNSVHLVDFIDAIEKTLGKKANKKYLPLQPGDVPITFADIDDISNLINFHPATSVQKGIEKFIAWYKTYYQEH